MERQYSAELAGVITSYLDNNDWKYEFNESIGVFKIGIAMNGSIKSITCALIVKEDEYIVYADCPIGVDPKEKETMQNVAELVCRMNCGLRNGNFEFNMDDGSIRYKSFVDCNDTIPSDPVITASLLCPARMFEQYSRAIIEVIFTGADAKEAVAKAEQSIMDVLESLKGLKEMVELFKSGEDSEPDTFMERLKARLGMPESDSESALDLEDEILWNEDDAV